MNNSCGGSFFFHGNLLLGLSNYYIHVQKNSLRNVEKTSVTMNSNDLHYLTLFVSMAVCWLYKLSFYSIFRGTYSPASCSSMWFQLWRKRSVCVCVSFGGHSFCFWIGCSQETTPTAALMKHTHFYFYFYKDFYLSNVIRGPLPWYYTSHLNS